MKPTLVMDIDGVCCDLRSVFNQYACREAKCAPIPYEETNYDWYLRYPDGDALWTAFNEPELAHLWFEALPIVGAIAGIAILSRYFDVQFATYRADHLGTGTAQWLEKRLGVRDAKVLFVRDKSDVTGSVYLDDHAATVERLFDLGRTVFVFDSPWNYDVTRVPRVRGWGEAVTAICNTLDREAVDA